MRLLLSLLTLCALGLDAAAKEFKLYAALLAETPVQLADGSKWVMDKGEVFPVLMYKEMQSKIVLQLSDSNFWTETKNIRLLTQQEIADGLLNYQKNVDNYLRSKAEKRADKPAKNLQLGAPAQIESLTTPK